MCKLLLAAALLAATTAPAVAGDWDDYWGFDGTRARGMAAARTPGYGEIIKGVAGGLWAHIRGLDQSGDRAGNGRCNCSVGRSDRAK